MTEKCPACKKRPKQKHFNSKWCYPCALAFRKRPKTTMTASQIRKAKKLVGKMSREEIAERLGVSASSLKRAFRGTRLAFYNYCVAKPELVVKVNAYYEEHGNKRTAEHFGIRPKQVEHIVYRYPLAKPRQTRWTDKNIIEAARMAGLVSLIAQAKYFNRPRAYAGSIKSLWSKHFGFGSSNLNGMVHWHAKELVNHLARYIQPVGMNRAGDPVQFRNLILWVDMEKCLKTDVPDFIRDAVHTMASFQRWIWACDNPKPKIVKMIKEREVAIRSPKTRLQQWEAHENSL